MSVNIGENIKRCRMNKKITQKDFADLLKKSLSIVQKYENNNVSPTIEVLTEISEVLEVPLMDLILTQEERHKYEMLNHRLDIALKQIDYYVSLCHDQSLMILQSQETLTGTFKVVNKINDTIENIDKTLNNKLNKIK